MKVGKETKSGFELALLAWEDNTQDLEDFKICKDEDKNC